MASADQQSSARLDLDTAADEALALLRDGEVSSALSGTAASVEEKLAQLGLDEAPPPSSNSRDSAGSSSADAAAGAPLSLAHQPEGEQICRICLDGAELPGSPLVQPCACRGSSTWAHADCLTKWRRTGPNTDAAYRCGQCKDDYRDTLSLELLEERMRQQYAAHTTRKRTRP